MGSNPIQTANISRNSSIGRVSDFQSECCGFDSHFLLKRRVSKCISDMKNRKWLKATGATDNCAGSGKVLFHFPYISAHSSSG